MDLSYELQTTIFSPQRLRLHALPDGHHLICQGADGRFFELDGTGDLVWEYINPITNTGTLAQGSNPIQNAVFRALAVPATHPGLHRT